MTEPEGSPQTGEVNALRLDDDDLVPEPEGDPGPKSPPRLRPVARPEFRAIFDGECAYVWHTLRRLGVHERDLEDVTHDVFVTVHRKLDDYDPARPIKPWIFGIAYRVASDYRRLARHRREVVSSMSAGEGGFEPADERPAADERYAAAQSRALVTEALGSLEIDRRAVFVMHELDGHAMPEIARVLSIPLNTAYSRLRLAREQFAVVVRRLLAQKTANASAAHKNRGGGGSR
jgi:RNA polymerase sigma-70 factor (ECF subfamily)